jgi:recombination protein RecR
MIFSSKLIEEAVEAFAKLPGIGKKTALRMVLHLLKEDKETTVYFSDTIARMRSNIRFCPNCNNISDDGLCGICSNPSRDQQTLCIVENIRDVISLESIRQYNGVYHVIGALLSPLDGIGPDQIQIQNLAQRITEQNVKEIIMALSPTIEGDTTVFYISKQLKGFDIRMTSIARGISFGSELEYADEITLSRSLAKRLPLEIV